MDDDITTNDALYKVSTADLRRELDKRTYEEFAAALETANKNIAEQAEAGEGKDPAPEENIAEAEVPEVATVEVAAVEVETPSDKAMKLSKALSDVADGGSRRHLGINTCVHLPVPSRWLPADKVVYRQAGGTHTQGYVIEAWPELKKAVIEHDETGVAEVVDYSNIRKAVLRYDFDFMSKDCSDYWSPWVQQGAQGHHTSMLRDRYIACVLWVRMPGILDLDSGATVLERNFEVFETAYKPEYNVRALFRGKNVQTNPD